MTNTYDIGNVVRLKVTFTDQDGNVVDPTDVQLNVRLYGGDIETFTYGHVQVLRLSEGIYYYDYTPLTSGLYYYRFIASGIVIAAADSSFNITDSPASGTWPATPAC